MYSEEICIGDFVIHRMSRVQLHDFSKSYDCSSNPGLVIDSRDKKFLILWDSYTEWLHPAYLLKIGKG